MQPKEKIYKLNAILFQEVFLYTDNRIDKINEKVFRRTVCIEHRVGCNIRIF
jgi:hypothetical protein